MWTWHFRTWFSRHGGVGLTVGLHDLRDLFQPYKFYEIEIENKKNFRINSLTERQYTIILKYRSSLNELQVFFSYLDTPFGRDIAIGGD